MANIGDQSTELNSINFSGNKVSRSAVSSALSGGRARGGRGGRPLVDLEPYKHEIIQMYQSGVANKDIVKWLQEEKQVKVHLRSVRRRLTEWKVPTKRVWIPADGEDEDRLRAALVPLVLQKMDDDDIVQQLKEQGLAVSQYHVARLRKEMGMRRRHDRNVTCDICKGQGRYPKEGCPHQDQHLMPPQRKSGEVSKSLRDEVKTLKKQMRDLQNEAKKNEKEQEKMQEQLQKEIEALKQQLKSAAWSQHFVDPTIANATQYGQYAGPSRWNT